MPYIAEYTDTFGGEANYSWVRRETLNVKEPFSQAKLMRAAKAAHDLTGCRGRTEQFGEDLAFYPSGMATVLFVLWEEPSEKQNN